MAFFRYKPKTSFFSYGNKKVKVGGYIPDTEDASDQQYSTTRFRADKLPRRVDLRPYMSTVENQGSIGSCTANSMAGAYEYLAMRALGNSGDVSRLFIYYNARSLDEKTQEDSGTSLRNCIKTLRQMGACLETTWPYDPAVVFEEPHETAYEEATRFLIEEAQRVKVDVYAMKHCLAEGYPFAFGLQLFNSFDLAGKNGGIVPIPDPENEEHSGGHAMLCVGYSDKDKVFVVRNSWGTDWGAKGYCYIPYDYLANPDFCGDCWTIKSVTDIDFSEGVWQEEGSFFDEIVSLASGYLDSQEEEDEEDEDEDEEEEDEDEDEEEEDEEEDEEDEDEEDEEEDEDEEDEDEEDEGGSTFRYNRRR